MQKLPLPCIILAGGKSSRMGEDKALLPFGEYKTLAEFQLARLKSYFTSLHVSVKSKEKFDFQASFIEDTKRFRDSSPLVALYSVLKQLKQEVFVLSVDTPFVDREIFDKLYKMRNTSYGAIVAKSGDTSHQLCAIYNPIILPKIEKALEGGNHKIRELFRDIDVIFVEFQNEKRFLNLNYKDEYEKAKKWLNT